MDLAEPFVVYAESTDYSTEFAAIAGQLSEMQNGINEIISLAADVKGIFIFFAVSLLCYFVYKFFRIFF